MAMSQKKGEEKIGFTVIRKRVTLHVRYKFLVHVHFFVVLDKSSITHILNAGSKRASEKNDNVGTRRTGKVPAFSALALANQRLRR